MERLPTSLDVNSYIYDWNTPKGTLKPLQGRIIEIEDETMRDGLQGTYIKRPNEGDMRFFLNGLTELGIRYVNIGYPGSSNEQFNEINALASYSMDNGLGLHFTCAARADVADIDPIIKIKDQTGMPFRVGMFLRSSLLGSFVEGWSTEHMREMIARNVSHASEKGLEVMFVTEDSTRTQPETLYDFYNLAIQNGATTICVADTVGTMWDSGVTNIMNFVMKEIAIPNKVRVAWHGHNDLDLGVANALRAAELGAEEVGATWGGIGERSGNVCLELFQVNAHERGAVVSDAHLNLYSKYLEMFMDSLEYDLPPNHPLFGRYALSTATGVHARAIEKAEASRMKDFEELIYSAIRPSLIGRKNEILVGPPSGASNVRMVLEDLKTQGVSDFKGETINTQCDPRIIQDILSFANLVGRVLEDKEILRIYTEKARHYPLMDMILSPDQEKKRAG